MLSGNELVAEGLGLFLEVLEAFGLAGGAGFEGFAFVVGLAAGDHAVEDAGEFVGGGDHAFGFAEAALRRWPKQLGLDSLLNPMHRL